MQQARPILPTIRRKDIGGQLLRRPLQGHLAATAADFLTYGLSIRLAYQLCDRKLAGPVNAHEEEGFCRKLLGVGQVACVV